MLELAGGQNAIGPTLMQYPQLGSEQILASGAEVIIHSAMSKGNLDKEQQAAETFWQNFPLLPAVKNNKIFVIEDRMNRRYWQKIDIWFPDRASALNFGIQKVKIQIVES